MKKKLIFALALVAIFAFIFAICAFANERTSISYTDAEGNVHEVPIVKDESATAEGVASVLGNKASQQALFMDNGAYAVLKAKDGTLTAFPTWYIIEPSGNSSSYVAISELEYTYVNKLTDHTFERGAVLYVEFPYGMTHMRNNGVFGRGSHYEKNVTEIVIPNTVYAIEGSAFEKNTSLIKVYIEDGSLINAIGDESFTECSSLEYFEFDKLTCLTKIDGFRGTKISGEVLDLTKNVNLVELGDNCFNGCKFDKILLPDSVKYLRNGCVSNCGLLEFTFPSDLEYIGNDTFNGNPDVVFSSGILPKNLSYVGVNFLYGCKNIPSLIVFPEGITTIPDEGFPEVTTPNAQGNLTIVFLGKVTKLIIDGSPYQNWAEHVTVYFAQNTISDFSGKVYSYTDKETGALGSYVSQSGTLTLDVSDRSVNSTSKVGDNFLELVFCGNNGKVEQSFVLTTNGDSITENRGNYDFDGHSHLAFSWEDDCTAVKKCIVCDVNIASAAHSFQTEISYPNGFSASGTISNACKNDGCLVGDYEEAPALIICLGYSSAEYDGSAISVNYKINNEAIAEYERITGEVVTYGVFAVLKKNIGENDIINEDGSKANGVIAAELNDRQFTLVSLKMVGFTTSEHKAADIVMGAYIVNKSQSAKSISYVQAGTPNAGEKYYYVSYNEFFGKED